MATYTSAKTGRWSANTTWKGGVMPPLYITRHTLVAGSPTFFKDCSFPKVIVAEIPKRIPFAPGLFDFVNCNLSPENFDIIGIEEDSLIRVQDNTTAYQINDKKVMSFITPFFNQI